MGKLTNENYFSEENQRKYWGVSQFKTFLDCEARGLAELNGEYIRSSSKPLLIGSYVDAYFEGSLEEFKLKEPALFKKDGTLKTDFIRADEIIERLKKDEMFMKYMGGEPQVIKTGKLFGVDWKIKIDSYFDELLIVDLKVIKDFDTVYKPGLGRVNFVDAWGYDIQGAVYQAIEGNNLPFVIAGATKEPVTDLELISVPQHKLDAALKVVEAHIDRFDGIKKGKIEPVGCGKCDYCKSIKKLNRVISIDELGGSNE